MHMDHATVHFFKMNFNGNYPADSLADGDVGYPSLYFTTEPTTGIYKETSAPGVTAMGFSKRGTKRMRITDTGVDITGIATATSFVGPITGSGLFPDGTVSAPSISFASDTKTGFYKGGTNEVDITSNGTKIVGINTTGVTSTKLIKAGNVSGGGGAFQGDILGGEASPSYAFSTQTNSGLFYDTSNSGPGLSSSGTKIFSAQGVGGLTAFVPITAPGFIGPITGTFANGSPSAPSITFTSDTKSGLYSGASGEVDVAANGFQVGQFTSSVFTATNLSTTGTVRASNGSNLVPSHSFFSHNDAGLYYDTAHSAPALTSANTELLYATTSAITSTVPIAASAGTNLLPSITFSGDNKTGIYQSVANEIDFVSNTIGVGSFAPGGLSVSNLISQGSVGAANGSAANPAFGFTAHANDGIYYDTTNSAPALTSQGTEILYAGTQGITTSVPISSGTQSFTSGAIISSGTFSNGTKSMTTGAITSSGAFSNGTNSLTTGALSGTTLTLSGATGNDLMIPNMSHWQVKNTGGTYESFLYPRFNDNCFYIDGGTGGLKIRTNGSGLLQTISIDNAANTTFSGSVTSGTNSLTCGALSCSAINDSGLTASSLVLTDGSKNLTSSNTLSSTVLGNVTKMTKQILSGSGTYTTPANVTHIRVRAWGAGGGGGGCATAAVSSGAAASGGGGGYCESFINSPASTYAYVVAGGGAGASAGSGNGSNGVATTFGTSLIVANPGGGGSGTTAGTAISTVSSPVGGTASGGDINITGSGGGCAVTLSALIAISFAGGSTPGGGTGASSKISAGTGNAANSPGGGGGGGVVINGSASAAGAAGAAGLIIVEEYYIG